MNVKKLFNGLVIVVLLLPALLTGGPITQAEEPLRTDEGTDAFPVTGVSDMPFSNLSAFSGSVFQYHQTAEPLKALMTDEDTDSDQRNKPAGMALSAISASEIQTPTGGAENLEFVGHIGGATHSVFVEGDYAYIGEGASLTILDVSVLASPTVVGKTGLFPYFADFYVSGSYAYVADWYDGLWVVDVSDPTKPHRGRILRHTWGCLGRPRKRQLRLRG